MITATDKQSIDSHTIQAWDHLYSQTNAQVWGKPAPFVVELIKELGRDLTPESRVLDAGTGEGRHLPLLVSTGAMVFACDASGNALHKVPAPTRDAVKTEICELSRTPFKTSFFDLILMNDVFETLPDPGLVLKEMHRLLSPSGRLICNIPDEDDGVSHDNMTPLPDGGYLYNGQYYYRFWEQDDAIDIFHQHNLEILTNKTYTWQEEPHPTFRNEPHSHTSRVIVAQRMKNRS